MTGRHRWTKTGLKQQIAQLRAELRAEQTKSARLADELALCQPDMCEIKRLQAALKAWESRWANAHPVSVPAPRDLRPADERPTVPTDVSSIRAIHRVVPIAERPAKATAYPVIEQPVSPDAVKPTNVRAMPEGQDTQLPAA